MNVPCKRLELDEIWAFVGTKAKNAERAQPRTREQAGQLGDAWTWTALDPDTKLMLAWHVGLREAEDARIFVRRIVRRLDRKVRVQVTSDGLSHYVTAIENAFGWGRCDYAQIIKEYGCYIETKNGERRYSPSTCTGFYIVPVMGNPDPNHISTSHVERSNLTIRMHGRRFTRLTNAFSKKLENLERAVSLHFMWYNFGRRHMTIKTTPAFKAGVTDHVWSLREIAEMEERYEDCALLAA